MSGIDGSAVSDWRDLVLDLLQRVQRDLHTALKGLTDEELATPLGAGPNPPGWLAWHLTRSHDRNFSEIAGIEQVWIANGWHTRFGRPADRSDTGYEHTSQQVTDFASPAAEVILAYHDDVVDMARSYLQTASIADMDRIAQSPTLGTADSVRRRLVGIVSEGFQHLGQIQLRSTPNAEQP